MNSQVCECTRCVLYLLRETHEIVSCRGGERARTHYDDGSSGDVNERCHARALYLNIAFLRIFIPLHLLSATFTNSLRSLQSRDFFFLRFLCVPNALAQSHTATCPLSVHFSFSAVPLSSFDAAVPIRTACFRFVRPFWSFGSSFR